MRASTARTIGASGSSSRRRASSFGISLASTRSSWLSTIRSALDTCCAKTLPSAIPAAGESGSCAAERAGEPRREPLGVHHDDRDVVADPTRHRLAPQVELRLVGQRHARGLDDHALRAGALVQLLERLDEAIREPAADAAARELDQVFLRIREQRAVDAELAELVADHRDAQAAAARVGEQVAHQRRLARAEKARDEHDRNARAHGTGRGPIWKNQVSSEPSELGRMPYLRPSASRSVSRRAGSVTRVAWRA